MQARQAALLIAAVHWTQTKLIFVFLALSAFGSWAPVIWLWQTDGSWQSAAGRAVAVWHAFPPMLAALFISGSQLHQPVLKVFGLSLNINRWWWVAWTLPVVIVLLALGMLHLLGGELTLSVQDLATQKRALMTPDQLIAFDQGANEHLPPHPLSLLLWALPAGITFNLLPALAEEIGFRGFLFREVPGEFWQRSLRIAALWSLWFAPAAMTGMFGDASAWRALVTICLWCFALTPLLMYLRVRAQSLIPVAIFRGTLSALTMPSVDIAFAEPAWLRPIYGMSVSCVLILLVCALALFDRRYYAANPLIFGATRAHDST